MHKLQLALMMTVIATQPLHAADHVSTMVGRVLDSAPLGAPTLLHRDGRRDPARYPALIYVGDHILVQPRRTLGVVINGRQAILGGDEQSVDLLVKAPSPSVSAWGNDVLDSLRDFLNRPRAPFSGQVYARDANGPLPPISVADSLVPAGHQLLPFGTRALAIVWDGAAAGCDTVVDGKTVGSSPSLDNSWANFPITAAPDVPFVVKLHDSAVAWNVAFTNAEPRPPGLGVGPAGKGDRLARAVWLLRSGPVEWRLFALSEIAAMADADDFVAGELWQAAKDGQLDLALGRS